MIQFTYTVQDDMGIHARPAGQIVKLAKDLQSKVTIEKNGVCADARRLISLLGLNVLKGETVTVRIEGETEQQDAASVESFFQQTL